MAKVSLLGIPYDGNSSYLKGPAAAPPLIRRELRHFKEGLALDLKTPVYLSVDLDGLDPAFAPGVSHREPGGFTTRQVIGLSSRSISQSSPPTLSNTICVRTFPT